MSPCSNWFQYDCLQIIRMRRRISREFFGIFIDPSSLRRDPTRLERVSARDIRFIGDDASSATAPSGDAASASFFSSASASAAAASSAVASAAA